MIRTIDYLSLLHEILEDTGLPAETLEIVPDVQAWCLKNGMEERNPNRTAKCLCRREDGACHIVLAQEITDDQIRSAKTGMEWDGFVEEVRSLKSDREYLIHLMLHEVACHVLKTIQQGPRDEWAFSKMSSYAV